MSEQARRWTLPVDAPPRCGDCQSSAAAECWHRPKCEVCGFKLIDPDWCSGCDAESMPTFDALPEPLPLPATWSPNGWNYADPTPPAYSSHGGYPASLAAYAMGAGS